MATIPIIQLLRNNNIYSTRADARSALELYKKDVPDGGLILATYSSDNAVKTLLGIVRNSGSENAQITIMDVEGAAENVQDAIDALSAYTNTKLTEEKNAREAADTTLQTNIDNLSSSTDTKINAEVQRATGKEAELSSTITSNYTTLTTAIDDEKKRAEAQETALNAKIESLGESLGNTNSVTVASGEYSSQDKKIYLKNISGQTLSEIDATDFIKDGMVTSVSVVGENLVITFNTDAGHEDILIPISDIFNAENYYTKTEIDTKDAAINATIEAYGQVTSQSLNDLGTRLNDYGQTTSQALNDLATRLSEEATSRESGDTTLQNNINALSGDTKTKIDAEAQARTSGDTTLQGNIDALSGSTDTKIANETSARQSADTTLQTNIDNVNSALTAHTANTVVHVTQEDKDKWNKPTDLSNYYTKSEVDEKDAAINSTIEAYGQVTSQALNDLGTRLDDYGKVTSQSLNDLSTKFGDYYTKTEVDSKDATINATIEALSSDTKNKIDAEASARQEADNTLQGNINNVNSSLTAHTANTTVHVTQADKDKWNRSTDLSNYYTKAEVDGKDATLQTALDALDAHVSENEDIVSQSLNDLNNRIGNTYVKSYIDALEARIAELETKFLNMENNGLQAGEY